MRDDTTPTGPLETLADELEAVSPGFAGRLRETAARLGAGVPVELMQEYSACVRRVVVLEGAGREASQALIALDAADLAGIGVELLEAWCAAAETIAGHSVRAASVFGAAALTGLRATPRPRADELGIAADAVAALARRHGGDPIVQRFATAAGQALATRGGAVVEAWATAVERIAFGSRRALDVASRLPDHPDLSDAELAAALALAARVAPRVPAHALGAQVAGALGRSPG
ncbi:MAG: hypothetical protein AB1689_01000, partial [Thermodesulfobacteriota bacterium]